VPSLPLSVSQVNKLGDRLRDAQAPAEEDLGLLEQVLAAYGESLNAVRLRSVSLGFSPAVRVKTTGTVIDKLRRERGEGYSLRLTRIQDLAGARVVIDGSLDDQNTAVARIVEEFADERPPRTTDRRAQPSFGYRAVHVVVTMQDLPVEVQIRTDLQDAWAQAFERLADAYGRGIRYGEEPQPHPEGDGQTQERRERVEMMLEISEDIAFIEAEKNKYWTWLSTTRAPMDDERFGVRELGAGIVETIAVTREYEARIRRLLDSVARATGGEETP